MAIGSFVRLLLQRLAAEQVQQRVADNLRRSAVNPDAMDNISEESSARAAASNASDQVAARAATPDKRELLPCHVGLVVALQLESGYIEDRLSGLISIKGHGFTIRTGGLAGRGVAVAISGHGQERARRATEALIEGHRPRWVISAGFAGGLQDQLNRCDIVMADCLVGEQGERLSIDLRLPAGDEQSARKLHAGRLLTVDRIIRTADEKRALRERFGAIAVDMESLAVAQVCQQEKQRFLAIRAITDAVNDELPRDVERLLDRPTMVRKLGAAAGSIVRRPSAAKDLWKLRESATAAADRLAKFLAGIIEQLPD
jgi:adenosylhomocysteine nucleosidase